MISSCRNCDKEKSLRHYLQWMINLRTEDFAQPIPGQAAGTRAVKIEHVWLTIRLRQTVRSGLVTISLSHILQFAFVLQDVLQEETRRGWQKAPEREHSYFATQMAAGNL